MRGSSSTSTKLATGIVLVALIQLVFIIVMNNSFNSFYESIDSSLSDSLMPQWSKDGKKQTDLLLNDTIIKTDYPCFPPRHHHLLHQKETPTVIYLETAYINLHYETYYSFIHQICSCDKEKDSHWTINTHTIPHFYVGPEDMLTVGFESILQEYNTTTCGPIYFGKPNNPDLTIVTTSYPNDFDPSDKHQYHKLINDPRYIFICHEDAPFLEQTTNVFFLTPLHNRYIIPSFFPPTLVQKHSKSLHQLDRNKPPIFLVLGSFNNKFKRNVDLLRSPLKFYKDVNFTIRFLGGGSAAQTNEILMEKLRTKFPDDYHKIEFLPRTDTEEFLIRVSESDVILPLVDASAFYHEDNGYQNGKKLTSSIMWGLGFAKKMVLYRPLAESFGIQEDNVTIFLHGDATARLPAFFEAFGRCLDHLLGISEVSARLSYFRSRNS